MSDEAPLIELIVNADPGVNYQWKAAAQAQGAHAALPLTALWCLQTMGKEGEKGQDPQWDPQELLQYHLSLLEIPRITRTCPEISLDAQIPFRCCVKVLLK